MSLMTQPTPLVADELDSVADALHRKFPDFSRAQVLDVVAETYRRLLASATIQSHLIPLTMNAARSQLNSDRAVG